MSCDAILNDLFIRHPSVRVCESAIREAVDCFIACYSSGGKLLVCGNGGSAADAEHIVGELMKGFIKRRPVPADIAEMFMRVSDELGAELVAQLQCGLPAIALTGHTSLNTAFANDVNPHLVFAQQVFGYGKAGDILMGLSTSGNAKNVRYAFAVAKALGLSTVGLTGKSGGTMKELCDILIAVPEESTPLVQELHLPVYHALCSIVEEHFFAA